MNALTNFLPRQSRPSPRPASSAVEIPSLESVSPEYRNLLAKRADLLAEHTALHQQIVAIANEMAARREEGDGKPRATEQDRRVAAMLGDPPPELPPVNSALASAAEIEHRQADISAAVAVLEVRIARARMEASAEICAQIAPHFQGLVAQVCRRMIALHEAVADYTSFAELLNERGIAWASLHAMPVGFAHPRNRDSPLARFLREAVEFGFIPRRDVPEELR